MRKLIVANLVALGVLGWLLKERMGPARAAESGEGATIELSAPGARSTGGARTEDDGGGGAGATSGVARPLPRPGGDPPVPNPLERGVAAEIARAVRDAERLSKGRVTGSNSQVAVHVVELPSGAERVAIQSGAALRPASNHKLLTAAAALALLGVEHVIETPFEARGTVAAGRLEGDLVCRAAGDPLHADGEVGDLARWLDDLAAELRAAGIERVTGELVLDEGGFADPAPGPAWPGSEQYTKDYCALAGGFSANAGCLAAIVRPTRVGERASVRIWPKHHGLERKGEVRTSANRTSLVIHVGAAGGRVTVRGELPADVPEYAPRFSHPDPVELFGHAVVGGLAARGVSIAGGFRRERGAAGGERVASLRTPLRDLLAPMLRDSDNAVSDQVFLHLGMAKGDAPTRAGGREAVARALRSLGVSTDGLVVVDGSGLSRDNRVSPRQLTALIAAVLARADEGTSAFVGALPVAGETGSLAKRMRAGEARGRVFAKTGFIHGTSGLSGIAEAGGGRRFVFSILVSYPHASGLNTSVWKPMQDRICERLVAAGGAQ